MKTLVLTIILLGLFGGCHSDSHVLKSEKSSSRRSAKIITKESVQFNHHQVVTYVDMADHLETIQLEMPPGIVLDRVQQIRQDPESQDLMVATYENLLLRFDSQGRFKHAYGNKGQGPGEYRRVRDFSVFSNGDVLLSSTFKLIVYDAEGTFLDEVILENLEKLPFNTKEVEIINDYVYLFTVGYRHDPNPQTVFIYDRSFNRIGEFHPHDERTEKMPTEVVNQMTKLDNTIVVTDSFDYQVNQYSEQGDHVKEYLIAQSDFEFENIDDDRLQDRSYLGELAQSYFESMNTVQSVYGLKKSLFIYNTNGKHVENRVGLFNLETATITHFVPAQQDQLFKPNRFLPWAVGTTFDHRLIVLPGGLDQQEWFTEHWPEQLESLEYEEEGILKPTLMVLSIKEDFEKQKPLPEKGAS